MEQRAPFVEAPLLDRRYAADVMDITNQLIRSDAEPLYHDEFLSEDAEYPEGIDVGLVWRMPEGNLKDDLSVSVALYSDDGRYSVKELIKDQLDAEGLPLGHVVLTKENDSCEVAATMYVFDSGDIAARLECGTDVDEILSEDSQACYELLESVGLGSAWVNFMFTASEADGSFYHEIATKLDESSAIRLISFLTSVKDRV
jgi:hypothetical protein